MCILRSRVTVTPLHIKSYGADTGIFRAGYVYTFASGALALHCRDMIKNCNFSYILSQNDSAGKVLRTLQKGTARQNWSSVSCDNLSW